MILQWRQQKEFYLVCVVPVLQLNTEVLYSCLEENKDLDAGFPHKTKVIQSL
jgi:hypothetical protein